MSTELTVKVPASVAELATEQSKVEALALALRSQFTIASADEYSLADEMLSEVARRKSAAVEQRKSATGPLYGVVRTVESWFRPLVSALDDCERELKRAMGTYRVELERREREARELAAKAAETPGNAEALVTALIVASEAAVKPEGRATTRFMWAVAECNPPAMSREFLVPDLPRLEALAKAHKGDEPPIVPGVTFKRVAQIGAKK